MQLASKESDIEQLRAKLLDLSDSTSVASFPSADETDGNLPGKNCVLSLRFAQINRLFKCTKAVCKETPEDVERKYVVLFCLPTWGFSV